MTHNMFRKIVVFLLFVLTTQAAVGQITKISLGVNGLTCSQCSRSVEMQLRKIDFIDHINMNLEQTNATLSVKTGAQVDFKKIATAVKDAGFSLRYLNISFDMSQITASKDCFQWQHKTFFILGEKVLPNQKVITFQIIGKGFLPDKQLSDYTLTAEGNCRGRDRYFLLPKKQ